jgi:hypothetical protein
LCPVRMPARAEFMYTVSPIRRFFL